LLGSKEEQRDLAVSLLPQISGEITPQAQEAINTLVVHNQRLVLGIAKKYMGRGLDLNDLHQEGST